MYSTQGISEYSKIVLDRRNSKTPNNKESRESIDAFIKRTLNGRNETVEMFHKPGMFW